MSDPERFVLNEAFNDKNSKVIHQRLVNGVFTYRVAVKMRNSRKNADVIYVSRELTKPLSELLAGRLKTGFHFATTQDLNSPGWQRLGDF